MDEINTSLVPFHQVAVKSQGLRGTLTKQKYNYLVVKRFRTEETSNLAGNVKEKELETSEVGTQTEPAEQEKKVYFEGAEVLSYTDIEDLVTKLRELGDKQNHIIVVDGNIDEIKKVLEWLDKRDNSTLQNGGHVFWGAKDATNCEVRNKNLSVIPVTNNDDPFNWAYAFAKTVGKYGEYEPARPFQTLEVEGLECDTSITFKKKSDWLKEGFCAWSTENNKIKIERIITTVDRNKDPSYLDLNSKFVLSYLVHDLKIYLKEQFPRCMLSEDSRSSGNVVTPKVIVGYIIDRHNLWIENNLVQDPHDHFKKTLKVEVDKDLPGRVNLALYVQLMGQLRQTVTTLNFRL